MGAGYSERNAMKLRYRVAAACLAAACAAPPPGYGPGMMEGYGPGMMRSYGPGMMGARGGMMLGYAREAYAGVDLTPDQRKKMAEIEKQASEAQWKLMGSMHQSGFQMQE